MVVNPRVEQFSALGQEDRLRIFRLLVRAVPDGHCVDDIKRRLKMPGSTLSHHLDALTRSRLLSDFDNPAWPTLIFRFGPPPTFFDRPRLVLQLKDHYFLPPSAAARY